MVKVKTKTNYQIYLVGGAVRDKHLGYPYSEQDWVVVGAKPEQLIEQGFQQVGKDFPVFLHPETKEEYALARTEKKSGQGYHGFEMDFHEGVTLEEDLSRRDLTINAMAMDGDGVLIDPYNGKSDLDNKILRHVSNAFSEDPLRLLRVARFAARYHHLGFRIADETMTAMQAIVESEELLTLTVERIWRETDKALVEQHPHIYFQVLRDSGALKQLFPEVDVLFGIPNPERWHPEIDTGIHTLMVLEQCALLTEEPAVRFAALCHDLGKGNTPSHLWPKHRGHERAGVTIIKQMCQRLKIPNIYNELACLGSEFHLHAHKAFELRPETLLKVLEAFDFFRRPERFDYYMDVCEADFRGRTGYEDKDYPQRSYFEHIAKVCRDLVIDHDELMTVEAKKRSKFIHNQRLEITRKAKSSYQH